MKSLQECLNESIFGHKQKYTLFPKNRDELLIMIDEEIKKNGNKCNLNHIDVSNITNMSYMFKDSAFNGDISKWDVSNVTNMRYMFWKSEFDGDISNWDVSNVKHMGSMFNISPLYGNEPKWYK